MKKLGWKVGLVGSMLVFICSLNFSLEALAKKPFAGTTLRIVIDQLPATQRGLNFAVKEFEKLTGAKVVLLTIPYHELHEKIMLDLMTEAGVYDLVCPDGAWNAEVIESGHVIQIDKFVEELKADPLYNFDDLVPGIQGFVIRRGHWYALPVTLHTNSIMVYRKDLFEAAGFDIPSSWESYNKAARFFTESELVQYGCVASGERDDPIIMEWMNRMLNCGGTYDSIGRGCLWDEKWVPTFNSGPGVEGAKLVKIHCELGPPGPGTVTWDTIAKTYVTGRSASAGTWDISYVDFEDPKISKVVGKNLYFRFPVKKGTKSCGMLAGRFYFIPKACRHKEAAFSFIKWATSNSTDKQIVLKGGFAPIRVSNHSDPELTALYPWGEISEKIYPTLLPEPQIPEWMHIKEFLGLALSQIVAGTKTPKEGLDIAAERTRKLFEKVGYK